MKDSPKGSKGPKGGRTTAVITDFKKLRIHRKIKRILRAALVVLLVLFATFLFSSIANQPNFVDVNSIFDFFRSGPGYPIEAPGGKSKGMYQNAGNLILLNETNLYSYNANGYENSNIQHRMVNPQIVTKGNMTLNFDRGSKSYTLYHRTTVRLSDKSDYPIKAGDISEKGDIILATQSDTSQSTVIVMDAKQQEKFSWKTANNVTNVAISANGSKQTVAGIYVEQGVLKTKLIFLRSGKQIGERILEDQLVLSMKYQGDELHMITEKGTLSCDAEGKILGQYDFKNQTLAGFALHETGAVLLFGDYEQARSYTMLSLGADLYTVNGSCMINDSLQKIKVQKNTICVLGTNTLNQYSVLDCRLLASSNSNLIYDIQPMGKYIYAMTNTQILRCALA